jgi:hypothetical protein
MKEAFHEVFGDAVSAEVDHPDLSELGGKIVRVLRDRL